MGKQNTGKKKQENSIKRKIEIKKRKEGKDDKNKYYKKNNGRAAIISTYLILETREP